MADNNHLVGLSDELHRRLDVQARNLLFEYKYAAENRGFVPVEVAGKLMRLYGELIAKLIFEDQERERQQKSEYDPVERGVLSVKENELQKFKELQQPGEFKISDTVAEINVTKLTKRSPESQIEYWKNMWMLECEEHRKTKSAAVHDDEVREAIEFFQAKVDYWRSFDELGMPRKMIPCEERYIKYCEALLTAATHTARKGYNWFDLQEMSAAYEKERAQYLGGIAKYPDNQAAFIGCMKKALSLPQPPAEKDAET